MRAIKSELNSALRNILGTMKLSNNFLELIMLNKEGYTLELKNKSTVLEMIIHLFYSFLYVSI